MEEAKAKLHDTKKRIFEAALACFTEKGYAGTTMDDVIAAAGVSKGSLYWHFESKKNLFMELVDYWFEGMLESFESVLHEGETAARRIERFTKTSLALVGREIYLIKAFMEFFNIALKDSEFRERLLKWLKKSDLLTAGVIEEGIDAGEFGVIDARRNAEVINSLIDGVMMRHLLVPEYLTEESMEFIGRFIERALKNEKREGK